jgi:hypothetical protein
MGNEPDISIVLKTSIVQVCCPGAGKSRANGVLACGPPKGGAHPLCEGGRDGGAELEG